MLYDFLGSKMYAIYLFKLNQSWLWVLNCKCCLMSTICVFILYSISSLHYNPGTYSTKVKQGRNYWFIVNINTVEMIIFQNHIEFSIEKDSVSGIHSFFLFIYSYFMQVRFNDLHCSSYNRIKKKEDK